MEEIVDHGHVVRGWLGIEVQDFSEPGGEKQAAVTVVNVLAGTPAEAAGLRAGDVLTRIDDTPVGDPQSALNAIARIRPGNRVTLSIARDGEPLELHVTVAQRPPQR
jgi:S1-C subfamily serine protease